MVHQPVGVFETYKNLLDISTQERIYHLGLMETEIAWLVIAKRSGVITWKAAKFAQACRNIYNGSQMDS